MHCEEIREMFKKIPVALPEPGYYKKKTTVVEI